MDRHEKEGEGEEGGSARLPSSSSVVAILARAGEKRIKPLRHREVGKGRERESPPPDRL